MKISVHLNAWIENYLIRFLSLILYYWEMINSSIQLLNVVKKVTTISITDK